MAKLSARGRTEVFRLVRTLELKPSDDPTDSTHVRYERAYMSDRVVLEKRTYLLANGRVNHNTGWNVAGRLKKTMTFDGAKRNRLEQGWEEKV